MKGYNVETRFSFGWDQARDANVIWSMLIEGKPTLIGPQVVSDNAFFLGPLWYYLLTPFYIISGLDPLGAIYSVIFTGLITILAMYFFIKKIAGAPAAMIASVIWAGNSDILAWNPMLVPVLSIGLLYGIIKIIEGSKTSIVWSLLLFGLSLQIHFQMTFFFIPLLISWVIYIKKNKQLPLKEFALGISLFTLTFAPLIIFDLRHEFLNSKGVLKILGPGMDNPEWNIDYFTQLKTIVQKNLNSNFFLPESPVPRNIVGIFVLSISLYGLLKLKTSNTLKFIFFSVLFLPFLLFSFYKGRLSEYYFALCLIPIILGFAYSLTLLLNKNFLLKILVISFLFYITYLNIKFALLVGNDYGLIHQKNVVKYLKNQTDDNLINVSYDVPYNYDVGFKYLIKYYRLNTKDAPEAHLWTISIPSNKEPNAYRAVFGSTGIIRR
jgi:4-amino-4-deoxy-L-arabinose transferase-like glycosyltransferase